MSVFNESDSSTSATFMASPTQSVIIVTVTSSQDTVGTTQPPVVVTEFSTFQFTPSATTPSSTAPRPTQSITNTSSQTSGSNALGTGGTIAVAVAVPVVVLALLAVLLFFCWRRRKRNKDDLAQRKHEQDIYAFHPTNDNNNSKFIPSQSNASHAYRGWQPTNASRQPPANTGYQLGRNGSASMSSTLAATTPAVIPMRRTSSHGTLLETPTLPAFQHEDFDSVVDAGPPESTYGHSIISPGNGSPPLNAINHGSPSSEYSESENNQFGHARTAPYPTSTLRTAGMASFMPDLQPGPNERLPTLGHAQESGYADGKSYINF